jgi:hypothetical protein
VRSLGRFLDLLWRDNSWEFPLLLKYRLPLRLRHFGPSVPLSYSPSVGFVAGGGLQFNLGHLRLAPQIRYTRWATAPVGGVYYSFGSTYSSNQNQLEVLVGISWKVK